MDQAVNPDLFCSSTF